MLRKLCFASCSGGASQLGVVSRGSNFFLKRNFYLCARLYMFSIVGSVQSICSCLHCLEKIVALKKVLYMLPGTCQSWGSIPPFFFCLRKACARHICVLLPPQIPDPTASHLDGSTHMADGGPSRPHFTPAVPSFRALSALGGALQL